MIVVNLQLDVGEVVEVVLIALEAGLQRRVGALVARVVHRVQLGICHQHHHTIIIIWLLGIC